MAGPAPLRLPDDVGGTLHEGRQAYVAVSERSGPHVTPELYAWSGGRLWFASATGTVKTKVLRRDPTGGALVSAGGRSILLRGRIDRFDARHPVELARHGWLLGEASLASAGYVVRNAPDLLAFGLDLFAGRLGRRLPPLRVLHSLTPDAAAVLEAGEVVERWGHWPERGRRRGAGPLRAVSLAPGGAPAVVAVPGPLALPGRWDEDAATFRAPAGLVALAGLGSSFPMSVVLDEYVGPGPAAKEGTLLRGTGRRGDAPGELVLDPDRSVDWQGVVTVSRGGRTRPA